ncbi:MAG: 3-methyl-2-oxobutanoate hydroxymethyltransferase [Spirochaetota bacterium]
MKKVTIKDIIRKKGKEKISALTAYDYQTALIMDNTDLDLILVGDSLGNVIMGYDTTIPVTIEDIIHHAKAVIKGAKRPVVVLDMPFMSFQINAEDAVRNAGKMIKETEGNAVKIEGGKEMSDIIKAIVRAGIPVMGHIGLKPQSINLVGKPAVQNRGEGGIESLIEDAKAVEEAGAFSIVLELIPMEAAKQVTEAVNIPTIGIGAGMYTDGQILVINDMLGYDEKNYFKHSRKYLNMGKLIREAVTNYIEDVKSGDFPSEDESFK